VGSARGLTMSRVTPADTASASVLPGIDAHPHARAVLEPALPPAGTPSHAYLFHGPPGTGKRTVARAFAAALLADDGGQAGARTNGQTDRRALDAVAERVARGTHPDLTWVTPSGAGEMLVGDIDQAVVAAAAHTPFESRRRVFAIEDAHTMNDQVANRLLKTLEEPPPFVHLILLAHRPADVLPTISSRCQAVRFDPLPSARIQERLVAESGAGDGARGGDGAKGGDGAESGGGDEALRLSACARLALGDARLAARLAGEEGRALRDHAETFVDGALRGDTDPGGPPAPWIGLLQAARDAGTAAAERLAARQAADLELVPAKERKRHEREGADARRRAERRGRTGALDLALGLVELWLRDLWCLAEGAGELVHAVDRRRELERHVEGRSALGLREGVELVRDTRLSLGLNVSEELALEALAYRLQTRLAAG
jgi:DNA polymerase III subunit delta'